ncbi:MAG: hypothetical protein PHX47_02290 [Candidatus ainarchaeum sp.]|nr:hypothetical protein [Candidatus ainarchaeum sp.]
MPRLFNIKNKFKFSSKVYNSLKNTVGKKNPLKQVIGNKRELIYSKHAKSKVAIIPKLIPSFLLMFKKVRSYNSERIKEVSMILNSISNKPVIVSLKSLDKPSLNSFHTQDYLLFEIKSGSSSSKYFVKHTADSVDLFNNFHGAAEIKALDIISKAGFNVVPAHFGYVDKVNKKSFIFYEFQEKLIDAETAYNKKLINDKQVFKIRKALFKVEQNVNKFIPKYKDLKTTSNATIKDVFPFHTKEAHSLPVFIDPKSKKLYIYDPWLLE